MERREDYPSPACSAKGPDVRKIVADHVETQTGGKKRREPESAQDRSGERLPYPVQKKKDLAHFQEWEEEEGHHIASWDEDDRGRGEQGSVGISQGKNFL